MDMNSYPAIQHTPKPDTFTYIKGLLTARWSCTALTFYFQDLFGSLGVLNKPGNGSKEVPSIEDTLVANGGNFLSLPMKDKRGVLIILILA